MNMNGYTALVLTLLIVVCGILYSNQQNNQLSIESAKAGLQQCPVKSGLLIQILWQKECKNWL